MKARQPLTELARCELKSGDSLLASGPELETLTLNGDRDCINGSTGQIIWLTWETP